VDNRTNKRAAKEFATAFAESLSASLTEAMGEPLTLKVLDTPDLTTRHGQPVHYRLTVDGGVCGQSYVELYEPQVAELGSKILNQPLAPYRDEHADALANAISAATKGLAEFLPADLKYLMFKVDRVADLAFGGMLVMPLAASTERGSTVPVLLYFDATFLARLNAKPESESAMGREDFAIDPTNLKLVMDVELVVSLRFGQRQLPLREVLELSSGSVIELDRQVEEPVELLLDGKVIARGEAVIVDGNYGLRVTEVPEPIASHLGR
jgi:flagellar motor switch protein FliN/FliY